jgi:hypothetical protein
VCGWMGDAVAAGSSRAAAPAASQTWRAPAACCCCCAAASAARAAGFSGYVMQVVPNATAAALQATLQAALQDAHPCCSPELRDPASMPSNTYPFFSAGSPCTHTHIGHRQRHQHSTGQPPQQQQKRQQRSARERASPPCSGSSRSCLIAAISTYAGATAVPQLPTTHLVVVHVLHCVGQATGGAYHRDCAVPQRNHLHNAVGGKGAAASK